MGAWSWKAPRETLERSTGLVDAHPGASAMHDYPLKQRTIGHVLADNARGVGDRTWLIFGPDRYSRAEAHDLSNRYANGFRALGSAKRPARRHPSHLPAALPRFG